MAGAFYPSLLRILNLDQVGYGPEQYSGLLIFED